METELDGDIPESLLPYVIHFGERTIAPKVVPVQYGLLLHTIKVNGPRLLDLLQKDFLPRRPDENVSRLQHVYSSLGTKTAYVSKIGVVHGDLGPHNVVVENGEPYIIDWEMASLMPVHHKDPDGNYEFWMRENSSEMLKMTKDELTKSEQSSAYGELERIYSEEFRKELNVPLDVSHQEIEQRAYEMFGVI